jgi:galactonate dehydratase
VTKGQLEASDAMKITRIQTYLVQEGHRNLVFVKVITDDGLEGIGEAYSVGPDEATAAVVHDFERWLVGEDPANIEHLWQLMYNGTRFPGGSVVNAAISGIEHALWDIQGKALGVPVYRLLGGRCRDRVRVYQGCGGATPEELADNARALIARYGYTALKIGPHPPDADRMPANAVIREAARRLEAVREAVGPDVDIGVDPHAKIFEPARAVAMAQALKPYQPFFFEEPLRPENMDALAKIAAQIDIPLATGEMLYTKFQFRDLLVRQCVDIIQPDVCCAGGLLECKKIAAMAEAFYVTVAPHNPMGPVATAVNVQLAACIPNFLILEYIPDDRPGRQDLVREPLRVIDGHIPVPDRPGLGIELNEEAFELHPFRPWRRGVPIRADGSVGYV